MLLFILIIFTFSLIMKSFYSKKTNNKKSFEFCPPQFNEFLSYLYTRPVSSGKNSFEIYLRDDQKNILLNKKPTTYYFYILSFFGMESDQTRVNLSSLIDFDSDFNYDFGVFFFLEKDTCIESFIEVNNIKYNNDYILFLRYNVLSKSDVKANEGMTSLESEYEVFRIDIADEHDINEYTFNTLYNDSVRFVFFFLFPYFLYSLLELSFFSIFFFFLFHWDLLPFLEDSSFKESVLLYSSFFSFIPYVEWDEEIIWISFFYWFVFLLAWFTTNSYDFLDFYRLDFLNTEYIHDQIFDSEYWSDGEDGDGDEEFAQEDNLLAECVDEMQEESDDEGMTDFLAIETPSYFLLYSLWIHYSGFFFLFVWTYTFYMYDLVCVSLDLAFSILNIFFGENSFFFFEFFFNLNSNFIFFSLPEDSFMYFFYFFVIIFFGFMVIYMSRHIYQAERIGETNTVEPYKLKSYYVAFLESAVSLFSLVFRYIFSKSPYLSNDDHLGFWRLKLVTNYHYRILKTAILVLFPVFIFFFSLAFSFFLVNLVLNLSFFNIFLNVFVDFVLNLYYFFFDFFFLYIYILLILLLMFFKFWFFIIIVFIFFSFFFYAAFWLNSLVCFYFDNLVFSLFFFLIKFIYFFFKFCGVFMFFFFFKLFSFFLFWLSVFTNLLNLKFISIPLFFFKFYISFYLYIGLILCLFIIEFFFKITFTFFNFFLNLIVFYFLKMMNFLFLIRYHDFLELLFSFKICFFVFFFFFKLFCFILFSYLILCLFIFILRYVYSAPFEYILYHGFSLMESNSELDRVISYAFTRKFSRRRIITNPMDFKIEDRYLYEIEKLPDKEDVYSVASWDSRFLRILSKMELNNFYLKKKQFGQTTFLVFFRYFMTSLYFASIFRFFISIKFLFEHFFFIFNMKHFYSSVFYKAPITVRFIANSQLSKELEFYQSIYGIASDLFVKEDHQMPFVIFMDQNVGFIEFLVIVIYEE